MTTLLPGRPNEVQHLPLPFQLTADREHAEGGTDLQLGAVDVKRGEQTLAVIAAGTRGWQIVDHERGETWYCSVEDIWATYQVLQRQREAHRLWQHQGETVSSQ